MVLVRGFATVWLAHEVGRRSQGWQRGAAARVARLANVSHFESLYKLAPCQGAHANRAQPIWQDLAGPADVHQRVRSEERGADSTATADAALVSAAPTDPLTRTAFDALLLLESQTVARVDEFSI